MLSRTTPKPHKSLLTRISSYTSSSFAALSTALLTTITLNYNKYRFIRLNGFLNGLVVLFVIYLLDFMLLKSHILIGVIHFTRPLYDKHLPEGSVVLSNYDFDLLNINESCRLYNLKPRIREIKIYDTFLFDNELDLLEIKLNEQNNLIEKFILIESSITFTNHPKKLNFNVSKNEERYRKFNNKIEHLIINESQLKYAPNTWARENTLRETSKIYLRSIDIQDGDMILFTDVDEIVRKSSLELIKYCDVSEILPLKLFMKHHIYSFEFVDNIEWWRSVIIYPLSNNNLNTLSRFTPTLPAKASILDGGWHCSWCFPKMEDFIHKIESYSHSEHNQEGFKKLDEITKKICQGKDLFDRWNERFTFKDIAANWDGTFKAARSMVDVPLHLKSNMNKFKYLIPGNCKRES